MQDSSSKAQQQQQQQQQQQPQRQETTVVAQPNPQTDLHRIIATDPQQHLQFLMHTSSRLQPCGRKEATGGVLPCSRDPETGVVWLALGLNRANKLCHFHGWVDSGERIDQGAAREAWEESKAILGSLPVLWRAVTCKYLGRFSFSAHVGRGGMHVINFGDKTAAQRDAVTAQFDATPAWNACSDEVIKFLWFPAPVFMQRCVTRKPGKDVKLPVLDPVRFQRGLEQQQQQQQNSTEDSSEQQQQQSSPIVAEYKLRGWLGDIFADPQFWQQPIMREMVERGTIPLLPISALPPLTPKVEATLPYRLQAEDGASQQCSLT